MLNDPSRLLLAASRVWIMNPSKASGPCKITLKKATMSIYTVFKVFFCFSVSFFSSRKLYIVHVYTSKIWICKYHCMQSQLCTRHHYSASWSTGNTLLVVSARWSCHAREWECCTPAWGHRTDAPAHTLAARRERQRHSAADPLQTRHTHTTAVETATHTADQCSGWPHPCAWNYEGCGSVYRLRLIIKIHKRVHSWYILFTTTFQLVLAECEYIFWKIWKRSVKNFWLFHPVHIVSVVRIWNMNRRDSQTILTDLFLQTFQNIYSQSPCSH